MNTIVIGCGFAGAVIARKLAEAGEQKITGTVEVSEMMGSAVHLHVSACGTDTIMIVQTMDIGENTAFPIGSSLSFSFGGHTAHVFDRETGENLELPKTV